MSDILFSPTVLGLGKSGSGVVCVQQLMEYRMSNIVALFSFFSGEFSDQKLGPKVTGVGISMYVAKARLLRHDNF